MSSHLDIPALKGSGARQSSHSREIGVCAPSVIVIVINEPDSPPRIRRNFGDDTHFTITTVYNFVARLYAFVHCLGRDRCGIEHCGPRAVLAPHHLLGDQSLVLMHDFVLGGGGQLDKENLP